MVNESGGKKAVSPKLVKEGDDVWCIWIHSFHLSFLWTSRIMICYHINLWNRSYRKV